MLRMASAHWSRSSLQALTGEKVGLHIGNLFQDQKPLLRANGAPAEPELMLLRNGWRWENDPAGTHQSAF